ncbi:phosphocarrier protein [Caminicella sporogenes DSM 14501]|uniref:Phosphocarrier protein HPr n=1 Tax=Caminicella sporogenes DSM 14501 TaxID=1121266 RepID=A0A1M6THI6_9FIRM|nr:HPr family phosphocarrier protein [Caminicella sporogenes]RKD24860.1 phosphocarrier protein HPr [Caminicella sporogenes]WIF95210.1 HPr family phosphocarrier protein [Caminicella sporogenes]SHK56455.1 phosphocarrier protein [Caminicella sporogenes DSM 14501]
MYKLEIELRNETGLHVRPASLFVKEAAKYKSEISIIRNNVEYNGKSIMGILSMGAAKGDKLMIIAKGEDEKEAIKGLKALVDSNFGE